MEHLFFTLFFAFAVTSQALEESYEVSGPFLIEGSRSPKKLNANKVMVVHHSWLAEPFEEANEFVMKGVSTVRNVANSGYEEVKEGLKDAANSTEEFVLTKANEVSKSIKTAVTHVGNEVKGAVNQTKIFILKSTKDANGFFSSAFDSATNWFSELEAEAKELMHIILRVIEVSAVIVILVVFFWILKRITAGYRFVKGIAGSFEMQDRTAGHETV